MKKRMKYFAVAATCMLAACSQKEALVEETPSTPVSYILAQGNENTKAAIADDASFTWKAGDKIAVYADGEYKLSDELVSGESSSATFAFSGAEAFDDAQRAQFALYPASLACDEFGDKITTGVSAASMEITLPREYNLSDVKDTKSPVFMIATNTAGASLAFKHLGALLRFKLVSVPKQTKYITFDFNGKRVSGPYTLTSIAPGTTAIVAEDTSADDDIITVYNNDVFTTFQTGLIVNIPVPTGSYTDVAITTWDGEPGNGGHKINALTTPINPSANWTPGRADARKRLAYLPVFTIDGNTGIGNGKKAVFAPGNLQAILATKPAAGKPGTASNWQFAEHQYSALGNNTANTLQTPNAGDVIDLFAWTGASATYTWDSDDEKYGIVYPSSYNAILGSGSADALLLDWGNNVIDDGNGGTYDANTWRMPSQAEWQRVIQQRKEAVDGNWLLIKHGAKATLTSGGTPVAYGLILLPDQFTYPAGVAELKSVFCESYKKYQTSCSLNSYSLEDWAKLEAAGCVFLPLTNVRTKASAAETKYPGDAWYWSATCSSGANIQAVAFNSIDVGTSFFKATANDLQVNKSCARQNGAAVRLVRQVN